jgi:capsular exopolysaccharide synthesis family protein
MTRLSDALKRAAAMTDAPASDKANETASDNWQFAGADAVPAHVEEHAERPRPQSPAAAATEPVPPPPMTTERRTKPRSESVRVGDADRNKLVISPTLDSALVEQYRHLAAVLHHAQERSAIRSVMVTSAVPNEGKTLTATNLALTLSESYQRRVLLIDADLRRPRLREMFALPSGEGLVNILSRSRGGRLPVHQVSANLSVLTAGRVVVDPMSMLVSAGMKQLLDEARDNFDWVVVDTPPIAILPDANLLSAMIDTAVLVVSARSTPYPMVQRAAEAIGTGRILGVVLNRAEHAAVPVYDYGYPGLAPMREPRQSRRWWPWSRKSQPAQSTTSSASAASSGR